MIKTTEMELKAHKITVHESLLPSPKAIILISHGLGEHVGRYYGFMQEFNDSGLSVIAPDFPGHGKSQGTRGVTTITDIVQALKLVLEKVKTSYPTTKIGLFGHSMGGLAGIRFIQEYQQSLYSAVVSAPSVVLSSAQEAKIQKAKLIAKWLPFLTLSNGINPNELSRNKKIVEAYIQDALVHKKVSTGLAWSFYEQGKKAFEQAEKIVLPILVTTGTEDQLVPSAGVEKFFQLISSKDKSLKSFKGAYHEVFYDPEYGEIFRKEILGWFLNHLSEKNNEKKSSNRS